MEGGEALRTSAGVRHLEARQIPISVVICRYEGHAPVLQAGEYDLVGLRAASVQHSAIEEIPETPDIRDVRDERRLPDRAEQSPARVLERGHRERRAISLSVLLTTNPTAGFMQDEALERPGKSERVRTHRRESLAYVPPPAATGRVEWDHGCGRGEASVAAT